MSSNPNNISVPTLLLNETQCRDNIERMAKKAKDSKVLFRPHFKTHQSQQIGRWFREAGVDRITVSSLLMAEYFAADGWTDITVAFPVNILEIDRIRQLSSQIKLNLLVENSEAVEMLDQLENSVDLFIKIDFGTHRTGILAENTESVGTLIDQIVKSNHQFVGFLGHTGHSYAVKTQDEVMLIYQQTRDLCEELRTQFGERFPNLIISLGDTPTFSRLDHFEGMNEIRPGNFVFFDLMQWENGSCRAEEIAVAMACPVVAKHPERNEIVIYGGAVHFSTDRLIREDDALCFGMVASWEDKGWGQPYTDLYVSRLSQEHGIVRVSPAFMEQVAIGDTLAILPIHSCMTANSMDVYQTLEGKVIEKFSFGARHQKFSALPELT